MHHNYIIFLSKTCNFFTDYSAPPFAYMAVAKACQLPQFCTQTHTLPYAQCSRPPKLYSLDMMS